MAKKPILVGLLILVFSLSAAAESRTIEVLARKFSFTPNIIRVKRGDEINLRLISEDVTHGIYIDGYGLQTEAYPGQDGNFRFVADKAGRYIFRCAVACGEFHPFMVGYLVVGPNIRFLMFVGIAVAGGLISLGAVYARRKN